MTFQMDKDLNQKKRQSLKQGRSAALWQSDSYLRKGHHKSIVWAPSRQKKCTLSSYWNLSFQMRLHFCHWYYTLTSYKCWESISDSITGLLKHTLPRQQLHPYLPIKPLIPVFVPNTFVYWTTVILTRAYYKDTNWQTMFGIFKGAWLVKPNGQIQNEFLHMYQKKVT